jgi:eukaryotic-like serine/threonine-protein kinase
LLGDKDRDLTPQKLGRYEIVRVLGKGAMGIVYEGRDPNLDRRVAIKTVKVENLGAETAAEYEARFRTEARSAGRLQHPNIVSVYDAARDGDTAYLVMEFIHGDDLKNHIDKGRRYSLDETARIVFDLLAALGMAHQHNIVHRDIKPANLLIEKGGRVKLTDFGVARIQNSGEATRTRGGMIGTLKYMAPEQVQGLGVDSRADLFSAGVVLYQLLTDRRPFDADTDFAIMHQVVHVMPEQPSHWHAGITPGLNAVVAKALAKSRDQRFQTADEFDKALREALRDVPDTTIVPPANPLKVFAAEQAGLMTGDSRLGGGTTGATATSSAFATSATSAASGPSSVTQELELVYWKDVRDSTDADELLGFLQKFPTGIYADLAKKRLKRLAEPQADEATRLAARTMLAAPAPSASPSPAPSPASIQTGSGADTVTQPAAHAPNDSAFPTTVQASPTPSELGRLEASPSAAAKQTPQLATATPVVAESGGTRTQAPRAEPAKPTPTPAPTPAVKPAGKPATAPSNPATPPPGASALWLNTSLYAPESQQGADSLQGEAGLAVAAAPISPVAESSGQLKPEGNTKSGAKKSSRSKASTAANKMPAAPRKKSKLKLWLSALAVVCVGALAWQWMDAPEPAADALAPAPIDAASQPAAVAPVASEPVVAASDAASASALSAGPGAVAVASAAASSASALTADPSMPTASATDAAASAVSASVARAAASAAAARARDAARRAAQAGAQPGAVQPVDASAAGQSGAVTAPVAQAVPAAGTAPAASRPPAPRPAAEGTADPKLSCEGRVLLGYFSCITDQCSKPQYARHPTCVEWREAEARRRREAELR